MRSLGKLALTIVVVALAAGPALAQRGQFGGGFGGPGMLLQNKSVQQELKLSEEQTSKIRKVSQEIRAKYKDEFAKAQELEGDEQRQKFQELGKKVNEETNKAL
ncbi:MAG TPA: hypothetical protein VKI65_07895, partial [Gemmataceae bacterium]|nr:hypothetical protein [Gemmataceae bacterium]